MKLELSSSVCKFFNIFFPKCNASWHKAIVRGLLECEWSCNELFKLFSNCQSKSFFQKIGSLISGLFFAHNLCFRCLNGWCKSILDIYISTNFQWYKEFLNPFGSPPGLRLPKVGVPLGVWRFIPSHSLALSKAYDMTLGLPSWPATLQPLTLVASSRLRLRHSTHSRTYVWWSNGTIMSLMFCWLPKCA